MTALAEGIETPGELGFLRAAGCERGQGFLFSRPVPANEIASLLSRGSLLPPD
jgi:EAL domain-containing protein (putative c-di-GMP-specific phosphodiesterase class I)